jgi:hypothetical protein
VRRLLNRAALSSVRRSFSSPLNTAVATLDATLGLPYYGNQKIAISLRRKETR